MSKKQSPEATYADSRLKAILMAMQEVLEGKHPTDKQLCGAPLHVIADAVAQHRAAIREDARERGVKP